MARGRRAIEGVRDAAVEAREQERTLQLIARARGVTKSAPGKSVIRDFGIPLKEEGDHVCGRYLGKGSMRKLSRGEQAQAVQMFKVERLDGAGIEIAGSDQLTKFFATIEEGQFVFVERGEKIKGGAYGFVTLYTTSAWPVETPEHEVREEYTAWLEENFGAEEPAESEEPSEAG